MTLRKPEGISWGAASVELPPMPVIPPGADAMSMTISAVLPTLEASMMASVTSLAAKEETFSGKVGAAQSAYNVADESGGQSVGQMGDMLGQLTGQMGQMSQMAQAPMQAAGQMGGQGGGFGQLMQQAMQGAQGAAQQATQAAQGGGSGPAGGPQPGGVPGAPTPEQRENEQDEREDQQNQRQAEQDVRDQQQDQREMVLDSRDHATAGPGTNGSTAGPAPIAPHGPSRQSGGEDLSLRT